MDNIVLDLYDIGVIKFGEFTLKSGIISPIYIDLRIIISYPLLLKQIIKLMYDKIKHLEYDIICGVPYTALPIATGLSLKYNKRMIMKRKEVKTYGTKKMIEGIYQKDDICLIIEDIITSGTSIIETYNELIKKQIKVNDVIVLIDREQGGKDNLPINLHSCFNLKEILNILLDYKKINRQIYQHVYEFLYMNNGIQIKIDKRLSYKEKSNITKNTILKQLYEIMELKQTNLCLSLDLTKSDDIINLINKCGPYICMIKTHIDIIRDFTPSFIKRIKQLSVKYKFLIFEDRKFADIGNTVRYQYNNGLYQISKWADIINCHILPGPGIIEGLKNVDKGILLLAQMSSKGNLINEEYTKQCIKYAKQYEKHIIGFISQEKISDNRFIYMTPGINLELEGDNLGQQYNTPHNVIYNKGSDILIVGRGIYNAKEPEIAAIQYKQQGWNAYIKSLLTYT